MTMEMPEGWKRLENRSKNDLPTHYLLDALDLMEEMAEALDSYTANEEDTYEKAVSVLNKIKEWK